MTRLLMDLTLELCDERLVLALEGGYNADALRDSVAAVLLELGGRSNLAHDEMKKSEDLQLRKIEERIEQVRAIQQKYWKTL